MLVWSIVSPAVAAPPTLSQVFPAGGQRGTTVPVKLTGKFDWPVNVWAPGVEIAAGEESGKLEISIPADLAADRVWLRLHNAEGASALVPFLIGSVRETAEQEPNNAPKEAQAIAELPVTINGALGRADVDGFAVTLMAGQTLVAALDANTRLGAPMDAILQVTSATGTVLAENHDAVGLDPRIVFTATQAGTHIVRVFAFPATPDSTIAFRGGDDYLYRLTLTTGPYLHNAVPLAVSETNLDPVRLHGWNLPADVTLPVQPFGGDRLAEFAEREPLGELRTPSNGGMGLVFSPEFAGSARVRIVPHEVVANIPAAIAEQPFLLSQPTVVTGWLQTPKQRDEYRLTLAKGQPVLITAEAHMLDFPVDPVLVLTDPAGNVAAEVDDASRNQRDAVLTHTPKQDGEYRLTVFDRYRHGGPLGFYRLSVRRDEADFELTAAADALVIPAGKPGELVVNIQRRNIAGQEIGPITFEGLDLPEGVTLAAVVSEPKGGTSTKVTLSLTSAGPAFSGPIRLVGKSGDLTRSVRTPAKLGAAWDTLWLTAIPAVPSE
jgi:hypothetical protein